MNGHQLLYLWIWWWPTLMRLNDSPAHVQSILLPPSALSGPDERTELPCLSLICSASLYQFEPSWRISRKSHNPMTHCPAYTSPNNMGGWIIQDKTALRGENIKANLIQTTWKCETWRGRWGLKGRNVTTHQHEWWHTAPSVAAPAPTSRLLSASTASQGCSSHPLSSRSLSPSLSLPPLPHLLPSAFPSPTVSRPFAP